MVSTALTSVRSYAEAPQSFRRSSMIYFSRQTSSSLQIPGKNSARDTNALASHSGIPSTRHLALRRENFNQLPVVSCEEGSEPKKYFREASHSNQTIIREGPKRWSCPIHQNSLRKSPASTVEKIKWSAHVYRSHLVKGAHLVPETLRGQRPSARRTRVEHRINYKFECLPA